LRLPLNFKHQNMKKFFRFFLAALAGILLFSGCEHLSTLYSPSSYTIDNFSVDPADATMEVLNGYKDYSGKVMKVSPANGINWSDYSRSIYWAWDQHETGQHFITISMSVLIEKPDSQKAQISAYKPAPKIWRSPTDIEWKGPPSIGWVVENGEDFSEQFGGKAAELPAGKWVDLKFSQAVNIDPAGQIYMEGHGDTQGLVDMTLYIRHFKVTMEKTEKYIALTFNDSPTDFTEFLVDKLDELDTKATFFIVGMGLEARHPVFDRSLKEDDRQQKSEDRKALIRRMLEEGHEVANMSYSCNYLGGSRLDGSDGIDPLMKKSDIPVLPGYTVTSYPLNETAIRKEIEDTQIAIQKAVYGDDAYTDFPWVSQYFRIPYGSDPARAANLISAAKALNLPIITGTDNSSAPSQKSVEEIADTIEKGSASWEISVNRDPRTDPSIIKVLDILIPRLKTEGYEFVTLSDLARISGKTLTPGNVYSSFAPDNP